MLKVLFEMGRLEWALGIIWTALDSGILKKQGELTRTI